MTTHSDFRRAVLTEFPRLQQRIDDCDGLSYMEMLEFSRFTEEAKVAADWDTYERAVRLAANFLPSADEGLMDELEVSYLEHLDFEEPEGPTAWRLLPVELQRAWHKIIDENETAWRELPVEQQAARLKFIEDAEKRLGVYFDRPLKKNKPKISE